MTLQKKFGRIADRIEIRRHIKGYEIVSLAELNRKRFMKRIVLSDYVRNTCLKCNNRLVKFVNFIPIGEDEGIRVPGKFCTKCDTFYEERGNSLGKLSAEVAFPEDYRLVSEYLFPHYHQKIKYAKSIQSAVVAVHVNCEKTKEHRLITIVSVRTERAYEQDVFHYSDLEARRVLYAIYKKNSVAILDGKEFDILGVFYLDREHDALLSHLRIDKIVLRNGGGLYGGIRQRGTELVDILLYSPFTDCFEVAHATHDIENNVYYMDAKVFRDFVMKYGNPGVKIAAYQRRARDFSTMREESILHAYGYVVGNNGLPRRVRQELLGEVMDLGIMLPHSILKLLDQNISMHPAVEYTRARDDWEIDRKFVLEYNVNPNRFVVATIGL